MLLQFMVFFFVLAYTAYFAVQGIMTAALTLVSAVFASILAIGIFEPVAGYFSHRWPDLARGLAFMLVFFLAFSAIRLACDFFIKKNVFLPKTWDRVVAGTFGFLAGLVVVGTCVIGLYMMPVPSSLFGAPDSAMGYDRYPSQANHSLGPANGLWLPGDALVQTIWDGAAGRDLGGAHAFARMHPHFIRELYGYRDTEEAPDRHTLPPNLIKVLGLMHPTGKLLKQWHATALGGKSVWVVRSEIFHGQHRYDASTDGGYLRLTVPEVRMVTSRGRSVYPVGLIKRGITYEPLTMASAIVDDYVRVGGHRTVIQNWVFTLHQGETPRYFSVKWTGRVALGNPAPNLPVLPIAQYPPHKYSKATLNVVLTYKNSKKQVVPAANAMVWILPGRISMGTVGSLLQAAYTREKHINAQISSSTGGWTSPDYKGRPTPQGAGYEFQTAQPIVNLSPRHKVDTNTVMQVLLPSQVQKKANASRQAIYAYYRHKLLPIFRSQKIASKMTNQQGKFVGGKIKVFPSGFCIVAVQHTPTALRVWLSTVIINTGESKVAQMPDDQLQVKLGY